MTQSASIRESLEIEPLTEQHDIKDFDCFRGNKEDYELNDFIQHDALPQKKEGWNTTYVAVKIGSKKVVGFFALSPDMISIGKDTQRKLGKFYRDIPAIKVGRLAVDKAYKGQKIGEFLVRYAIGHIVDKICPLIGGMYITIDSYRHWVVWYETHFNFRENTLIKNDGVEYVNLIFPIKDFKVE